MRRRSRRAAYLLNRPTDGDKSIGKLKFALQQSFRDVSRKLMDNRPTGKAHVEKNDELH